MTVTHGTAEVEPGLHYATAGAGECTVVLLHGFPQTWCEWRHVFAPLVDAGFRVVAPTTTAPGTRERPAGRGSENVELNALSGKPWILGASR
jgi:hypothetical protein